MTPSTTVCPCDAQTSAVETNLPGLTQIAFRAGDFNDFRRALLTPLLPAPGAPPIEEALTAWSSGVGIPGGADPSVADLAVMMVEWWAYLADILTFYNERIANEDYLGTATLPESASGLIRLLGYRPRPAIAATGTLAALVTAGQTATLPAGLQFQSKPGPGQAPQTFELLTETPIAAPDTVPATPATVLVGSIKYNFSRIIESTLTFEEPALDGILEEEAAFAPASKSASSTRFKTLEKIKTGPSVGLPTGDASAVYVEAVASVIPAAAVAGTTAALLLLQGTVTSVTNGTPLLLGTRDDTATPNLILLTSNPTPQNTPAAGKQTILYFQWTPPASVLSASIARLRRANQITALWTVTPGGITNSTEVHLAGVTRSIRPGDWLVFNASGTFYLAQVAATTEVLWDATSTTVPTGPGTATTSINVLHTKLDLSQQLPTNLAPNTITVLFNWVEFATLVDQPPAAWDGTTALDAIQPASFPTTSSASVLLQDAANTGASAQVAGGGTSITGGVSSINVSPAQVLSPTLQSPINVFYNLLPVTCGKTVSNEVLGSGDATVAGQSFMLSKSPVTYLASGSGYASTIALTVNHLPWTEVASFYGQPSDAQVFVTREDAQQNTYVDFGDGVNGARLPTGTNNVIATYRVGGGATSPAANKLTVIAQSYPGLRAILNPVAVVGGSDPDPASLLREYAPRSVLTFGRAVSIADYQALAAQAPGVDAAVARWSWNSTLQHAAVTVYVVGDTAAASNALAAAGDPNRPISIQPALPITLNLTLDLIVVPGMDTTLITAAVTTALSDPQTGLFALANLGIGQVLFDSQITATCLAVSGVVALSSTPFSPDTGPIHDPGEGGYFTPGTFTITTEADPNG